MLKEVCFITGNMSKFEEARLILEKAGISLVHEDIEIEEMKSMDQEEVVKDKARKAYAAMKMPVLVDDTGIYFKALNKFPGTYTKMIFRCIGFEGIESLLAGKSRDAFFQTMLCLKHGSLESEETVFCGRWEGKIVENISSKFNPDWQYDSIFVPDGFSKPLCEMDIEVRSRDSHRKKAFQEMIKALGA